MPKIIELLRNRKGDCVKFSCRHYTVTTSGEQDGSHCGKYEDKPNPCFHIDTTIRSPEVFDEMMEALIDNTMSLEFLREENRGLLYYSNKNLIEKICHPLKWKEIKDLLKDKD